MPTNGVPVFRVQWLPEALDTVKRLLPYAEEQGISEEFGNACRSLAQQLSRNPRDGADFLYHTQAAGGRVFRRTIIPFRVEFVVYETQRVVLIHRLELLPPHPLVGY